MIFYPSRGWIPGEPFWKQNVVYKGWTDPVKGFRFAQHMEMSNQACYFDGAISTVMFLDQDAVESWLAKVPSLYAIIASTMMDDPENTIFIVPENILALPFFPDTAIEEWREFLSESMEAGRIPIFYRWAKVRFGYEPSKEKREYWKELVLKIDWLGWFRGRDFLALWYAMVRRPGSPRLKETLIDSIESPSRRQAPPDLMF